MAVAVAVPSPTLSRSVPTIHGYRPEIDGLRALAVIAVIINHFNKALLPSGYLGVDIFFVISGYVITASLSRGDSKNLAEFLGRFYARRIRRLVPAMVVFVLVTSVLICLFNPEPGISLSTGRASLFGFSNLYLLKRSTDYFAQSTELNPFMHTWSLGVEEQFYLLFPLLVWFSGFGRQARTGARNLFLWIGLLSLVSLAAFIHLYHVNQPAAYFLMPTRFWEMAAGCLVFLALQNSAMFNRAMQRLPLWPVVAAIVGTMALPVQAAVVATLSIVVLTGVLIGGLRKGTVAFAMFSHQNVVGVGLISYSLYLWHWGVLAISRWTIGIHWWSVPFQVLAMALLAMGSFRLIEQPARRAGIPSQRVIFGVGVAAIGLSALFVTALSSRFSRRLFLLVKYPYEGLMTRSRNVPVDQRIEEPQYTGRHCHLEKTATRLPDHCRINGRIDRTAFFVGNSHADHYRETHYLLSRGLGLNIEGITMSSCMLPIDPAQTGCNGLQRQVESKVVSRVRRNDIVVVSNRFVISDEPTGWLKTDQSVQSLNVFAGKVFARGGQVVLIAPSPEFSIESRLCTKLWFRPLNPDCDETVATFRKARRPESARMQKLDPRILIFDPLPVLCPGGHCRLIDEKNKPLYVDKDHLTNYANRQYIYPAFAAFLKQHGLVDGWPPGPVRGQLSRS